MVFSLFNIPIHLLWLCLLWFLPLQGHLVHTDCHCHMIVVLPPLNPHPQIVISTLKEVKYSTYLSHIRLNQKSLKLLGSTNKGQTLQKLTFWPHQISSSTAVLLINSPVNLTVVGSHPVTMNYPCVCPIQLNRHMTDAIFPYMQFIDHLNQSNVDIYCQSDIISNFKMLEGVSQAVQLCSVSFQQVNRNL